MNRWQISRCKIISVDWLPHTYIVCGSILIDEVFSLNHCVVWGECFILSTMRVMSFNTKSTPHSAVSKVQTYQLSFLNWPCICSYTSIGAGSAAQRDCKHGARGSSYNSHSGHHSQQNGRPLAARGRQEWSGVRGLMVGCWCLQESPLLAFLTATHCVIRSLWEKDTHIDIIFSQ